jgi:hypothetical protein
MVLSNQHQLLSPSFIRPLDESRLSSRPSRVQVDTVSLPDRLEATSCGQLEEKHEHRRSLTASPDESWWIQAVLLQDYPLMLRRVQAKPSVCREKVALICRGQRTVAYPLHLLIQDYSLHHEKEPTDDGVVGIVQVIEALLTGFPEALWEGDSELNRYPLHFAVVTKPYAADSDTCEYLRLLRRLIDAHPKALMHSDCDGNLPLHEAVVYGTSESIELLLERNQRATQKVNTINQRTPLHLLCGRIQWTRCSSTDSVSLQVMERLLRCFPEATQWPDRHGRLPIHLACAQSFPRWDLLDLLIRTYPESLLERDFAGRTPLVTVSIHRKRTHGHVPHHVDAPGISIDEQRQLEASPLHHSPPHVESKQRWIRPFRHRSSTDLSPESVRSDPSEAAAAAPYEDTDVVFQYLRDRTMQEKRKRIHSRFFTFRGSSTPGGSSSHSCGHSVSGQSHHDYTYG